jgi:hypothetical protein
MINTYIVDEPTYQAHLRLIEDLLDLGISRRSSAGRANLDHIPERWRGMTGHQKIEFRRNSDFRTYILRVNRLLDYICRELGTNPMILDNISSIMQGTVETPYPNKIPFGTFDEKMVSEAMFSHAIVSNTELRYTTGISLKNPD